MLKKFFTVIITMITLFIYQMPAWSVTTDKSYSNQTKLVLRADSSNFFENSTPYELAKRTRSRDRDRNPSGLWIVSIFIMGLGQVLMGDILRGLSFYLYSVIIVVIGVAIAMAGGISNTSSLNLASGIISIGVLIIYIWNLVDAYSMAHEDTDEDSGIMNNKRFAELEKRIEKISRFTEKINASKNNVSYEVISF